LSGRRIRRSGSYRRIKVERFRVTPIHSGAPEHLADLIPNATPVHYGDWIEV
jgi:hypothetical protein